TSIDYHAEALSELGLTKSYLNIKIQPGLDRYYELGIVDDPRGYTETIDNTRTVNGGAPTNTTDVKTYRNDIKFNLLFAKNFYDFTIKGGILESSGGVALDYKLFRNRLKLSIEAFEFDNLHVRAFAKYNFFKGVYVIGGGDDIFSNEGYATPFFGAGIFITNDDLKVLASKVSF
ncbi:MAG: MCE family protein, partial [Bdellovibrionales bacterium]|nr:MCE family protein [Bdellovibrionales bacterium]